MQKTYYQCVDDNNVNYNFINRQGGERNVTFMQPSQQFSGGSLGKQHSIICITFSAFFAFASLYIKHVLFVKMHY